MGFGYSGLGIWLKFAPEVRFGVRKCSVKFGVNRFRGLRDIG